jgi:hypothetical protein
MSKSVTEAPVLLFLLILACKGRNAAVVHEQADSTAGRVSITSQSIPVQDSAVKMYHSFLNGLDETQVNHVKTAYLNYKWMLAGKTAAQCDSAYAFFERFYMQVYNRANESPVPQFANPKRLQQFKDSLKVYGFELAQQEGEWYYKQNRDFIATHFYKFVSPVMKEYLELMLKESKTPYASEGGLNIKPRQLADRFIAWNEFCRLHKDFILKTFSENYATLYGTILIQGIENTPLLTGEPQHLNIYYTEAYDYLLSNYSHLSYVPKFNAYKAVLLNNDEFEVSAFQAKWLPYEVPE